MSRAAAVARRVAAELLGVRSLLVALLLLGLALVLAAQADGVDADSHFASAARAVFAAPLLAALWALLRLPAAWPAPLRALGLPPALRVLAPLAGAGAAATLLLCGLGLGAGAWLSGMAAAPPCRARVALPLVEIRGADGRRHGSDRIEQFLARAGDAAWFALAAPLPADLVELQLEVFLGAQAGSVDLVLRLGSVEMPMPPLRPGPCRLALPIAAGHVTGPVGLVRTSADGPPVALGAEGLRLRQPETRSHVVNTVLAFLSLLPLFLLLAAVQFGLAPLLAPGPRLSALVLLAIWVLLVPALSGGLRSRELAEGRWLLDGSWTAGQLLPFVASVAAAGWALAVEVAGDARRRRR